MSLTNAQKNAQRVNVKQVLHIMRLILDIVQANQDVPAAKIFMAIDLHKLTPGLTNQQVEDMILKNVKMFNLLKKPELDI